MNPPTPERLLRLVEAMAGQPVVLLADLVADRFVHGSPKRISREAPVLILRYAGEQLVPGGGANAVANVAALDGVPLPLGVVGEDAVGSALLEALEGLGVRTDGVRRRPGYRTPTKTRILAGGRHSIKQQVVRYDVEDHLALDDDDRTLFAACLEAWQAERPRVALLNDYGYGAVDPGLVGLLRQAVGPEGTLVCDSRFDLRTFAGLDGATPNEEEAEGLLGRALGDDPASVREGGERLRRELRAGFLLLTRGSHGMALFTDAGCAHLPVHGTDEVADVTGAGDTVIGTFGLARAAGATPLEAAALANYAGGVVVKKMGTATLSRDELRRAIGDDPLPLEALRWESF